jgi:hypothetical protein
MTSPDGHDPLGHEILAQRLASIPGVAEEYLNALLAQNAWEEKGDLAGVREITISGTGSSLAHAQYLAWLLATVPQLKVRVESFDAFYSGTFVVPNSKRESLLVVISQGLSPNAQIVLQNRGNFGRTALLTSVTPAGARRTGKAERAQLVEAISSEGGLVERFPLEDEYEVLVRIVGPLLGYLAAAQFAKRLGASVSTPDPATIRKALESALDVSSCEKGDWTYASLSRGSVVLAPAPLCSFSSNLTTKFVEGLFVPAPLLCEGLAFAHGGFQFAVSAQAPVIMLGVKKSEFPAQYALLKYASEMCLSAGVRSLLLPSSLPIPFAILEYEMRLNAIIVQLMREQGIPQRNWPGKGLDRALYAISKPLA